MCVLQFKYLPPRKIVYQLLSFSYLWFYECIGVFDATFSPAHMRTVFVFVCVCVDNSWQGHTTQRSTDLMNFFRCLPLSPYFFSVVFGRIFFSSVIYKTKQNEASKQKKKRNNRFKISSVILYNLVLNIKNLDLFCAVSFSQHFPATLFILYCASRLSVPHSALICLCVRFFSCGILARFVRHSNVAVW